MTDKATGPLRGLKIVDISTVAAGLFGAVGILAALHVDQATAS